MHFFGWLVVGFGFLVLVCVCACVWKKDLLNESFSTNISNWEKVYLNENMDLNTSFPAFRAKGLLATLSSFLHPLLL